MADEIIKTFKELEINDVDEITVDNIEQVKKYITKKYKEYVDDLEKLADKCKKTEQLMKSVEELTFDEKPKEKVKKTQQKKEKEILETPKEEVKKAKPKKIISETKEEEPVKKTIVKKKPEAKPKKIIKKEEEEE